MTNTDKETPYIKHANSGEVSNPLTGGSAELRGAIACLTQNATHPADVVAAINCIQIAMDRHDELVAALSGLRSAVVSDDRRRIGSAMDRADAALAKARGEG